MNKPAETPLEIMARCIRERDKRKYGKWITHNTARGDVAQLLGALSEAGFMIVPKEPTEAMIEAGWQARESRANVHDNSVRTWAAMVAASEPTP